jgi:hypothetical protein
MPGLPMIYGLRDACEDDLCNDRATVSVPRSDFICRRTSIALLGPMLTHAALVVDPRDGPTREASVVHDEAHA